MWTQERKVASSDVDHMDAVAEASSDMSDQDEADEDKYCVDSVDGVALMLELEAMSKEIAEAKLHNGGDAAAVVASQQSSTTDGNAGTSSSSSSAIPTVDDASHNFARGVPVAEMNFEGGKITVYRNGDMVATCGNKAHGDRCRLTRTTKKSAAKSGRPIGICAWFILNDYFASAKDHNLACSDVPPGPRFESRAACYFAHGSKPIFDAEASDDEGSEEPTPCP